MNKKTRAINTLEKLIEYQKNSLVYSLKETLLQINRIDDNIQNINDKQSEEYSIISDMNTSSHATYSMSLDQFNASQSTKKSLLMDQKKQSQVESEKLLEAIVNLAGEQQALLNIQKNISDEQRKAFQKAEQLELDDIANRSHTGKS
jgi:hypothetical protein